MIVWPLFTAYEFTPLIRNVTVGLGKPDASHCTVTLVSYCAEMISSRGKDFMSVGVSLKKQHNIKINKRRVQFTISKL